MTTPAQLAFAQQTQRLFTSADGQTWLAWAKVNYGDRRSYAAGDPYLTAFHEGQRDVYLEILDQCALAADPSRLVTVTGLDGHA